MVSATRIKQIKHYHIPPSRLPLLRVTCLIHFLAPTTYEISHHNAGIIFNTRGYVRTVLCEIVLPSRSHHSTGVILNIITRAKRTTLLRQNFVMPRLCYGSAEQVNLLCSHLNRKVPFSPFRFQFFFVIATLSRSHCSAGIIFNTRGEVVCYTEDLIF